MTRDASDWTVRPYVPEDADGAMELIAACYGPDAVDRERWQHDHFGNPEAADGTRVAEAGGRLIGMQPMAVNRFSLGGDDLLGGVLTGVMVHPEWRRRGVFLGLLEACEKAAWALGADLVTTMPNERSRPGFLKRGYVDPGERTLMCRPLGRGRDPQGWHPARTTMRWALRSLALLRGDRRIPEPERTLRVQSGVRFDEAMDDLSQAAAAAWPGLFQHRSARWLSWRYPECRWAAYRRWVVRDSAGACDGLAVTTTERRRGLTVGYLVDAIGRNGDHMIEAVSAACRDLRQEGVDLILAVVSTSHLIEPLRRAGFSRVPPALSPKRFFTVFRAAPGRDRRLERLRTIDHWYQTLGDWDTL